MDVFQLLRRHEGEQLKPYCDNCGETLQSRDSEWYCGCMLRGEKVGNITIGVGINLSGTGIYPVESQELLENRVANAQDHLAHYAWFKPLDDVRKAALTDLCFNVGGTGFDDFVLMIGYIDMGQWYNAASVMRNSRAYHQERRRIEELATMLETGQWPTGEY